MLPALPIIINAAAGWIFRRAAKEVAPVVAHDVLRRYIKPHGGKMLKGKKTYIGIIVLAASFLAPQLGLTEGEVSQIVTQLTAAAGGILAIYGRWAANK